MPYPFHQANISLCIGYGCHWAVHDLRDVRVR